MNKAHLEYCGGPEWAALVRDRIVPTATAGAELGGDVLEIGPGPGATTDVLQAMAQRLTCVEVDPGLVAALGVRFARTNVRVVKADATRLPFADGVFSAAISLTMLHHLETPGHQDAVFAELARVVRAGGWVLGSDNLDSAQFREAHIGDTCTPIDPDTLPERLAAAGFVAIEVTANPFAFYFRARAPHVG